MDTCYEPNNYRIEQIWCEKQLSPDNTKVNSLRSIPTSDDFIQDFTFFNPSMDKKYGLQSPTITSQIENHENSTKSQSSYLQCTDNTMICKEKGDHMADVLLSLKHAVVHPHQSFSGMMGGPTCAYTTGGYQDAGGYHTSPHCMFPAMSVNVSMNMTMGLHNVNMGYTPEPPLQHHQWPSSCGGSQGSGLSPMACMNYSQHSSSGHIASPLPMSYSGPYNQPYSVGSYSWPGDLRGDISSFDSDFCIKSPPPRPRPGTPPGNYATPGYITMGSSVSPALLRRRNCVGNVSAGIMDKSLCGEALKTNLCRICGKTYARPSTLKTHLRTHSGEKPYRCNECNKSFSQAANLTAHVRTHSGEKPFRCPICDRRFSQSSSVTTHMRTHSGERPYRCRMCKKAFSDSSTLTKHLRIHSGEKPYQCKLCLLRFSQSGNLNRHMRVHAQAS